MLQPYSSIICSESPVDCRFLVSAISPGGGLSARRPDSWNVGRQMECGSTNTALLSRSVRSPSTLGCKVKAPAFLSGASWRVFVTDPLIQTSSIDQGTFSFSSWHSTDYLRRYFIPYRSGKVSIFPKPPRTSRFLSGYSSNDLCRDRLRLADNLRYRQSRRKRHKKMNMVLRNLQRVNLNVVPITDL